MPPTLAWQDALRRVLANRGCPGVCGQTCEAWEHNHSRWLPVLASEINAKQYRPLPLRLAWVSRQRPGTEIIKYRPLLIAAVRDRIVQTALSAALRPAWDCKADPGSFGYRAGLGVANALQEVESAYRDGYRFVLDADIQAFFDSVPHSGLKAWWSQQLPNRPPWFHLCTNWISTPVWDGIRLRPLRSGIPQGSPLSPPVANHYLTPLDAAIRRAGWRMIRYSDDFLVMTRSARDAESAKQLAGDTLHALGLTLHPLKTHIRQPGERFHFLGAQLEQGRARLPANRQKQDSGGLVFIAKTWTALQKTQWENGAMRVETNSPFDPSVERPPAMRSTEPAPAPAPPAEWLQVWNGFWNSIWNP